MRILSEADKAKIIELYPNNRTEDIAAMFGVSKHTIYNVAFDLRIKKDPEWVRQNARENFHENHPAKKYWIKPGTIPPNKGKKMEEFMTVEQAAKFRKNTFRKGHIPKNAVEIGTEVVIEDGYIKVKIGEPNIWKLKHRLVWEQYYGDIPENHNVQFKNGDRQDCNIENLYLISRSDQLKNENNMTVKYPKEVVDNIRALGYLKRVINKIQDQNEK